MTRKLQILFVFSLIIPVGVLTSFRLTGLLHGPISVSETITAPTVEWEMEKPTAIYGVRHSIENVYNSSDVSAFFNVSVAHYVPTGFLWDSWNYFILEVSGTAFVPEGHVVDVSIEFRGNNDSAVDFFTSRVRYGFKVAELENLTVTRLGDVGDTSVTGDLKAFATMLNPNNSRSVSFWIEMVDFGVRDGVNQPNSLRGSMQVTYFNGTTYKRIILPMIFTVMSDAGESFESAKLIDFGDYTGFIDNIQDVEDYFKIWLDTNQTVRVKLFIPQPEGSYMNLYFYDPNKNLVANYSSLAVQFDYSIHQSGYWYLRLENTRTNLLYVLSIEKVE